MQAERTTWNDERLDALATDVRDFRKEVLDRFDRIEDRFDRVDDHFDALGKSIDSRFDKLMFGMLYAMGSVTVAIVGVAFAVN